MYFLYTVWNHPLISIQSTKSPKQKCYCLRKRERETAFDAKREKKWWTSCWWLVQTLRTSPISNPKVAATTLTSLTSSRSYSFFLLPNQIFNFNISLIIPFNFFNFLFPVVIVEMRKMRRTEPEGNLRRPKRHRSSPRWEGHHSSHSKGDLKCPLRFIKLFFFFFNFSIQSMRRFIIVSERLWLPHKSL